MGCTKYIWRELLKNDMQLIKLCRQETTLLAKLMTVNYLSGVIEQSIAKFKKYILWEFIKEYPKKNGQRIKAGCCLNACKSRYRFNFNCRSSCF